jgi:hypothetical protein
MPSVEGVDDNVPPRGFGVSGRSYNWAGVYGISNNGSGVAGESNRGYGVYGYSYNWSGVYGESSGPGRAPGVYGYSYNGPGVYAYSSNMEGVVGVSSTSYGVYAHGNIGLYASSYAGYAALLEGKVTMTRDVNMSGPVSITGPLTKPGGSFKIDHPLDPANKYLYHSFVESPDMKNVYDGVVTLDDKGEAEIELPDWFGALNKNFRYQLTAIGAPGPNLYIAEEISDDAATSNYNNNKSRFKVAGGASSMKVSWQVTGIRKDPWANAHRISVEEDKPAKERGYYTYPELFMVSQKRKG